MLKVLPTTVFNNVGSAKCAEIYCQSPTDFTILCAFCEMKSFEFEDFLLHFKNIHFENSHFKTEEFKIECTPEVNVKNEGEEEEQEMEHDVLNNSNMSYTEEMPTIIDELRVVEQNEACDEKLIKWQNNRLSDYNDIYDSHSEDSDNDQDDEYVPEKEPKSKKTLPKEKKLYKCKECNEVCTNAGLLRIHTKKEHELPTCNDDNTPVEPVICAECGQQFATQRRLDTHHIRQHSGLQCTHCERRYKTRADLVKHEVTHSGIRNFICDFEQCTKAFFTQRRLSIHKRIHTKSKNFICDICGYSCREKVTLVVHHRTHTGEKPYPCTNCPKRFGSQSLLAEHRATHSTERPHICDVCGASFALRKGLYHHKHLHLGVKKFKCKVCDQAFGQMSGLSCHMRKHKEGLL